MRREKSCGAVVFHTGSNVEYLLLHYAAGHWDFPKGHTEGGESEKETATRELREETGLTEVRIASSFREAIRYPLRHAEKEVIFFLAESATKTVKLSREHTGYAWLPYEAALAQLTYPTAQEVLRKAHAFMTQHGASHATENA